MAQALGTTLRSRLLRMIVVLAVVAGVVVVSVGTGYRASQAVLDDGSAWLVKGRSIAHVNGETGRSDAEVARDLAKGGQPLEVVQTPGGQVYVVNDASGTVTRVDLSDMTPAAQRRGTPGKMQVLGSGADTYYVDRARGTVELVDPESMAVRRTVPMPAGITAAVAGRDGQLWVLDGAGTLNRVEDGSVAAAVPVGDGSQKLTLVDGRPLLVDGAGALRVVEDDEVRDVGADLPRDARVEVNQPSTRGGIAWVSDEDSGTLMGVDLAKGETRTIPLGSSERADLGPAVTLGTLVYVPDYTAHVVRVVDAVDGRLARTIRVVGTSRTFDLFVEDSRVWINDPAARSARVLDAQGRATTVDKGEGHGVSDPEDRPTNVPPPEADPVTQPPVVTPPTPTRGGQGRPDTDRRGSDKPDSDQGDPSARAPDPDPDPTEPATPVATPSSPASVAVPDVVGQPRDQACATLASAGLGCSPQGIGSRPGVPPDQVVATSPEPGTSVAAGTVVTVQHAGATSVPDLAGRSPQEACEQLLTPAGLECGPGPLGTAQDSEPVGVVVSQSPAAGQQVGGGTRVDYGFYDQFLVASYVGTDPTQACQRLATRPITCEKVDLGPTPRGQQPNQVIRQNLSPGAYSAGQTLRLEHYTGEERGDPVPNVGGMAPNQACATLSQAGYGNCAVVEHPTPSRQVGVVLSQSAAPGQPVPRSTTIQVTQETNAASEVCRYRKPNADVWLLRIGCDRSGIEDWQQLSSLGFAFANNQGAQPGTVWLYDNNCCDGAWTNHQITPGSPNGDPGWQNTNGTVGMSFNQDFGGMVEIVRMIRHESDGSTDYVYAIPGQESYSSQGFVVEQSLGFVWSG